LKLLGLLNPRISSSATLGGDPKVFASRAESVEVYGVPHTRKFPCVESDDFTRPGKWPDSANSLDNDVGLKLLQHTLRYRRQNRCSIVRKLNVSAAAGWTAYCPNGNWEPIGARVDIVDRLG